MTFKITRFLLWPLLAVTDGWLASLTWVSNSNCDEKVRTIKNWSTAEKRNLFKIKVASTLSQFCFFSVHSTRKVPLLTDTDRLTLRSGAISFVHTVVQNLGKPRWSNNRKISTRVTHSTSTIAQNKRPLKLRKLQTDDDTMYGRQGETIRHSNN